MFVQTCFLVWLRAPCGPASGLLCVRICAAKATVTFIQGGHKCHNPDVLGFSKTKLRFLKGSWG